MPEPLFTCDRCYFTSLSIEAMRKHLIQHNEEALRQRDGDQPLPKKNDHPCIQDMVMADIETRKALGIQRYGTVLQGFNGRNYLRDIYEELLDAAIYIRGRLYEEEHGHSPDKS